MKTAVIYARVSSREQEREGFSIQAQQRLLREYAAKNDFRIIDEFIDVETAKESGRNRISAIVFLLGLLIHFLIGALELEPQ
jgi:site-specific DNA recombinase